MPGLYFVLFLLINQVSFAALADSISGSAKETVGGVDLLTGNQIVVAPKAKGLALIFMSAKCPCSNAHVGIVKELANEFKDVAFAIIHSNADESVEFSKEYFKKSGLTLPVLDDRDDKIADQFKASKTPHAFLISPEGEILYRGGVTGSVTPGPKDPQYLREALSDLSAGRKIRVASTRTLGCAIERMK